ncbi:MAG: hypothetical protein IT378_02825 [Sandaracinaceae bacterium]|nr:hypothetical protein [Sandaracinaceae bacterium]
MSKWAFASLLLLACGGAPAREVADATHEPRGGAEAREPLALLGGRLSIQVPPGSMLRQRPHSIMGAPDPAELESVVFHERGEDRFALFVRELFVRCGDDLGATMRAVLDASEEPLPEPYETRRLEGPLQVVLLIPEAPERRGDAAAVLEAAICHPDGTLQWARAMVAGRDLDGLIGEGRDRAIGALSTLRAGNVARAIGARRVELPTYAQGRPLALQVPDGWVAYAQEGPDFRVHYLRRLQDTPRAPTASIGIYLGDHPSFHHGGPELVAGTLLGRPVEWRIGRSQDWRRMEAIVSSGGATGTGFVHAFGGASADALFAEVRAVLESLATAAE